MWFEEYKCGCLSDYVKNKRDLLGYCPVHGEDRRNVHPSMLNQIREKQRATWKRLPKIPETES